METLRLSPGPARLRLERPTPDGGAASADLDALALEMADRFHCDVYATAVAAIERYPDDFAAALGEALHGFLVEMRDQRLAYIDLFAGEWCRRRLQPSLGRLQKRKRERLIELWARYHERVNGLRRRDAEGLASFQYEGLRGLVVQVESGQLGTEEAITLFTNVLTAAAERLGGRTKPQSDRGGNNARFA